MDLCNQAVLALSNANNAQEENAMKTGKRNNARTEAKLVMASMLLGSCFMVQAATVSYSTSWSTYKYLNTSTNVDNRTDYLNDSGDWYVPQFDSALGALQSIDLVFSGMTLRSDAGANFRDDDWANEVAGYQRLSNMRISFSMPGLSFSRSVSSRSDTCSDTGGLISGASCSTSFSNYTQGLSSLSTTLTSAAALTGFTGAGSRLINIDQTGTLYTNETDGDDGYVNSRWGVVTADGDISITYNYSPVPVPAAAWLFGSGLLGLVGIARRKKAV